MPRRRRRKLLSNDLLLAMIMGSVVVPALLSLSVGIVALALWREAFDIVFGVLVLSFAASAIAGGLTAFVFVRRSAWLSELQADFVANVSHELRTPLAGIRLVADTLEAGRADDPARLDLLTEMLGDEARRLEDLVERILAWRRLEEGVPIEPNERLAIDELVHEVVASIRRLPEARGVTVLLELDADLPPVLGDRAMLRQALHNLVHNGVKFGGERGPVQITTQRAVDSVRISVHDRGPGISNRDLKRIFERFFRGSGPQRNVRGTGLGLDIVKGVVESHSGQVQVESTLGQGSIFTIRLPAARDGEGLDG